MIISTSSNVASSIYVILFDLLLQILLVWLVAVFLSVWNLKAVYDDRKPILLDAPCLPLLVHQGLTERRIGWVIATFSTVVFSLSIAGSFSINGVSRPGEKLIRAPLLVEGATPGNELYYPDHVSTDGAQVSGSFLMADSAALCTETDGNSLYEYSVMNDLQDISSVKWSSSISLTNSTCLRKQFGYKERIIYHEKRMTQSLNLSTCEPKFGSISGKQIGLVTFSAPGCPFSALSAYCSNFTYGSCVGQVRVGDCITTWNQLGFWGSILVECIQRKLSDVSIASMAYLLDTGVTMSHGRARSLAMRTVKENVDVLQLQDVVKETEIDIAFLCYTLGTAMGLTALLAGSTFFLWKKHVFDSKRRGYNRFYSGSDILACAGNEIRMGFCRFAKYKGVSLYLNEEELEARPII